MRQALVALAALSAPAVAHAHFAELQIDDGPFVGFLQGALTNFAGEMCPERVDPAACGGEPCYLDRLDIRNGGSLRLHGTHSVTVAADLPAITAPQLQYV